MISSPTCATPHKPSRSSPLTADASSPMSPALSSPLSAAQSRRRSQYKSRAPSGSSTRGSKLTSSSPSQIFPRLASNAEKDLIRQKFQTRCFKRAAQARENAVKEKRYHEIPGSDPFGPDDMDDDFEESEDYAMSDELYRRIVAHANSRVRGAYSKHNFGIPGSPTVELEDVDTWEAELLESEEMTPEDLELAELEAYSQEFINQLQPEWEQDQGMEDSLEWDDFDDMDAMDLS